jgi:AAA15 family ATPase/GTPase
MKLTLQKLQAQNFKGHKDIQLQFTDLTQIVGDNGTGKTSLVPDIEAAQQR